MRLTLQISQVCKVSFYSFACGQECFFTQVHCIYVLRGLGLEVDTLERLLLVS